MRYINYHRHPVIFIAFFVVLVPVCFFGYLYYRVIGDASTRIQRGVIEHIIASESPVYYDDGQTPIGVFFEKIHRKYVHYDEIPPVFIEALIASEDKDYFNHSGFDLKATFRALLANVWAGRVVQGGSTITQQTAKNVFRRERRSFKAKLKELIQAFLLERKYSKQEILEMYANQFFVSGYGKGIGIAAHYFFDKGVKDLDLVEAAFIAGSVKGPNRYNPFIKKSEPEKREARRLAKIRKDYVLSNMLKMHFISEQQYLEARDREIPFKEGKITYRLNVILDYIREQLESDYFRTILHEQGVDNIAASGISIYTSINKDIQEAALESLRSHLALIDVELNGYNVGQTADTFPELPDKDLKKATEEPFLSRITQIDANRENGHLVVVWGQGGGIIDYDGLKSMGEAWLKWKRGNSAVFDRRYVSAFLKNFRVGDYVPVQLMPSPEGSGEMKLVLSRIPHLQGAVVVIQGGMLRAMVGGYSNRFFNRAADAKRQLGSIFKPIVYAAALQLKWNNLDSLHNTRDIFRFENNSYLPRPDHTPQSDEVSMTWAGVKSENLATVWLLYHLTDHLNLSEFRRIADLVGLGREEGESYLSYKKRIRDRHGVVVNKEALMEAAFEESKREVESDIIFGRDREYGTYENTLDNLGRLNYDIDRSALDVKDSEGSQILRYSYKRISELNQNMKAQLQKINQVLAEYVKNKTLKEREILSECLRHFYTTQDKAHQRLIYAEDIDFLSPVHLLPLTPELLEERSTLLDGRETWIDDLISSEVVDLLQENITEHYRQLLTYKRYDMEVLSRVRDFRILVNLFYVVYISEELGISTKLDPVLSFPLGPNSISILEAALAYQTIMTGQVYPLTPDGDSTMVPIITKIVDREGNILWEYQSRPKKILSERVSELLTNMLRKVMEIGTGSSAKDAVQVQFGGEFGEEEEKIRVPVPSFGKTGTANQFTNSSFVGFIPGPDEKTGRIDVRKGYVISSYVGYDDNRPMKAKYLAIYGASGALPIWIDTANAIVNGQDYKKLFQPADLAFSPVSGPLSINGDFLTVPVSRVNGLPVSSSAQEKGSSPLPEILAEAEYRENNWRLKRYFEPILGEIE
jgi:penicillin-binding protein 1A